MTAIVPGKEQLDAGDPFAGMDLMDTTEAARAELVPTVTADPAPESSDDEPADDGPPWPAELRDAAFHGPLGEMVRIVSPQSEADPAALLVQGLVAFGNAAPRGPHVRVEATRHHSNLFAAIVGATAKGRKGTSWDRVRDIVGDAAGPEWLENCIVGGLSTGEGLIASVRDDAQTADGSAPGVKDKRLLGIATEFALILKRAARDNNTLSAVLREGWDSGFLRVLTRGDPLRASNVHLSCVAHITRRELRSSLTETESANGFANRFLYVCARRYRELPRGGRIDDAQIAAVRRRLGAALVFARDLRERVVDLDQDADRIWHAVYGPLGAVPDTLTGAIIARAEPQVLRLSLVYALADRSDVIRAPHLLAALEVWRYCRDSAMHVFGDRLGDALAEDVYHELQRAPGGLTRSELSDCFSRNVPAARLLGALAELKAAGRAQSRLDPAKDRGRPAERWVLSPGRIGSRGVDFLVLGRKALGATPAAEVAAPALPAGDDLPSGAFVPQHDRPGVCGTCGRGTTTYTYVCDECAGGGV